MLIEKLNMERIPEFHNKIKKSGTTFRYNLVVKEVYLCVLVSLCEIILLDGGGVNNKDIL